MQGPVLSKVKQGYWYWLNKLNCKPRALGVQFEDWVALSVELGKPELPLREFMGMYIFLIDGEDGRFQMYEHVHPRMRVRRDS